VPTSPNSSTCGSGLSALDLTSLRQVRKCADRYTPAANVKDAKILDADTIPLMKDIGDELQL